MQETSKLYKTLIAERGHVKEHRLLVAGEEYTGARIVSMESEGGLFEQDTVCVGGAVSRQLDVVLRGAGEIPKGAKLIPESRVRLGDQVSEWVKKGTFYIDTREPDPNLDTLTIHAFDDFLHMETPWIPDQSLEFPMPMDRAAAEVARSYGIEIDPRSRLRSDYTIDYPVPGTTGRDIFRHIATAHGGNWTMTDLGMARLIRLGDMAPETGRLVTQRGQVIVIGGFAILVDKESNPGVYDGTADKVFVGVNAASVVDPPALDPISKIIVIVDDENYYEAGDDSGRTLEVTCPYGTQAMADDLLKDLRGYQYKPLEAQDALIDPAAELGDGMTVNGVYTVLAQMATTFDLLMPSDIGAPGQREIESETGNFIGRFRREVNLSLARTRSLITKTAEQIRAEVKNEVEGLSASIDVQLGVIDEQVNGLDGRLGEVEVTAESVTQRVNGLDDAYAQIRTEVGSITSEVHELGGRMTLAEQTAEGFSREIDGLGGRFTKIEETVNGVTYTGRDGRVWINNGCLDLTGAITFSDLDDDTQEAIDSAKTRTFKDQPTGPYYVGDLWYKDDGTVWRCEIDEPRAGRFYDTDWEQVNDAGSVAADALTAANGKNQTFYGSSVQSPYNAGDLWFTNNGLVYRCNYTRTAYGQYDDSDWALINNAQELVGQWGYEYQGKTYMNGEQLMIGTVTASKLRGGEVQLLGENENLVGHIDITPTLDGWGLQFTTDHGGIRFVSGGNFYVQNNDLANPVGFGLVNEWGSGWGLWVNTKLAPSAGNTFSLGDLEHRWTDLYCVNGEIQTSDANLKKDIEDLPEKYVDMFSKIRSVRFRRTDGQSGRYHVGFIAQEVEAAMTECGIDSTEFAGFVKGKGRDEEEIYMLRYEELIGVLWAKVQEMDRKITMMEVAV